MGEWKFYTEVKVPEPGFRVGYQHSGMFVGSCFTENVGGKMQALRYPVDVNPFGIVYNPLSVVRTLERLIDKKLMEEEELFCFNGLWHSFLHHGRFSGGDKSTVLEQMNARIAASSAKLESADYLCITFGTAWIYCLASTGEVVANCHKLPADRFVRRRLEVTEITQAFEQLLSRIWALNPKVKIVFTVSPVRHWKDGPIENQRSKAVLLLAVEYLCRVFSERCVYFPAYEIVLDELRDYRFYASDMLHPSDVAVDYVWSKFEAAFIDEESRKLSEEVRKLIQARQHRPLNPESPEYKKFLLKMRNRIRDLQEKYSYLNLSLEENYFSEQLTKLNS